MLLQLLVERVKVEDLVILQMSHISVYVILVGAFHALATIIKNEKVEDGYD